MAREPFVEPPPPPGRRAWAVLAGIVLLAAVLRVYGLADRSIWFDEGSTIALRKLATRAWLFFNYDYVADPPLFPLMVAPVAFAVATLEDFWLRDVLLRLIPACFGTATVAACFLAGRRLLRDNRAALVAAFLTAVSPFHVYYGQELRTYALHGMLVLLTFWAADRALTSNRRRDWVLLLAAELLTLYSHFFAVWTVFGLNLYMLATLRRHFSRLRGWFLTHLAVTVLFLPALRVMVLFDSDMQQSDNWYPPLRWRDGLITVKTFVAGYAPEPWVYWPLFLLAVAGAAAGMWALRRRMRLLLFFGCVGAVPLVANLVIWKARAFSYYQHRFFIATSFVLYFMMAAGVVRLRPRWAGVTLLVGLAALSAPALHGYYAGELHPAPEHRLGVRVKAANRVAADRVRTLGRPGDRVAHYAHKTWMPMRHHYLDGSGFDVAMAGLNPGDFDRLMESLRVVDIYEHWDARLYRYDVLARGHERVWYVSGWWEPREEPPASWLPARWYDYHGRRIDTLAAPGLQLFGYAMREPGASARPAPLQLDYGWLTLPAGAPAIVPAGGRTVEPLRVGLSLEGGRVVLRAGGEPPADLTLTTIRTAALLPAMAFRRPLAQPRWEAVPAAWHHSPDLFPNRWVAALDAGERTGRLTRGTPIPPGRYRLLARVFVRDAAARGAARLHARVDTGIAALPVVTGTVVPEAPEGGHWDWLDVAAFDAPGGHATVSLWAEHVPGRPSGWLDLSAVALVADGEPLAAHSERVTLAAGEERRLPPRLAPTASAPRVDFCLSAPGPGSRRHVSLDAYGAPAPASGGPRN